MKILQDHGYIPSDMHTTPSTGMYEGPLHNFSTISNIKGHRHHNSSTPAPSRRDKQTLTQVSRVKRTGPTEDPTAKMINHWKHTKNFFDSHTFLVNSSRS